MRSAILFFILLFCMKATFAQNLNTETGLKLLSFTSQYYLDMEGTRGYISHLSSPLSSDSRSYNIFYDKPEVNARAFFSPTLFIRQKLFKQWWVRAGLTYRKIQLTSTDTFYESFGTSFTTYDSYRYKHNRLTFSFAPQYQWLNRKRIYCYSGIEAAFSYARNKLSKSGTSFGCFGGGDFNTDETDYYKGLEVVLVTNNIGYRIGNVVNIGYEFQTGYSPSSDHPIFIHQLLISKNF